MEPTQIVHELATGDWLPVEAIEAARANRGALVTVFVRMVEQFTAGSDVDDPAALYLVFHLLGEWREKSAYRPLAALLRLPTDDIDPILGDALVETCHRVMAAVFDGDPEPLYAIIRDPDADEGPRSRMCEALAMVTLRGEVTREETAQFLRSCFSELEPQGPSYVWEGWHNAIALLGLVELKPLVKRACEKGFIDDVDFEGFEEELRRGAKGDPPSEWYLAGEFELFGDTLEELATSTHPADEVDEEGFDEEAGTWEVGEPRERVPEERMLRRPSDGPAVNPYKDVGRNDPCPCGSGKKFKKCCLGKAEPPPAGAAGSRKLHDLVTTLHAALPLDDTDTPIARGYDPLVAPDPEEWLALDEQERIDAVMDFHRDARIRLPNAKVHAVAHVIVENQVAEGDALPVGRTLERLMGEGLDRHDAIHAIGMVLIGHMNDLMKAGNVEGDPNAPYFAELERLTAATWRRSG